MHYAPLTYFYDTTECTCFYSRRVGMWIVGHSCREKILHCKHLFLEKHSPFSCAGCSGPLHLLRIQPPTTTMLLRTRGIPHSLHHHTWLCDVCLRILPMCTQTAVLILHTKYATLGEPKIDVRVLILGGMVHEEQTDKVSRLVSMSGDFKLGIDSLVPLARTRYSAVQGCGRL